MKKALSAVALILLATACGGGGDGNGTADSTTAPPLAPGTTESAGSGEGRPDDVKAAPDDGINRPVDGTYTYTFDGQSESPNASPVAAPEDASFTSKVTNEGDRLTTVERTSIGRSTSTTVYRWTDEAVSELSIETKSSAGTVGCEMSEPIDVIRIPLEKGTYDTQTYEGDGAACDRTKEVEVVREETIEDAEGRSWRTWVLLIKTVGRSTGLTEEFSETKWFSPDLGKDIKTQVKTTGRTANDTEAYSAETSTLLRSYPT